MQWKIVKYLWKTQGWHDAAFYLGQVTHQVPFVNLKWTHQALHSKSCSRSQDISSLALYHRRIPNHMFKSYNICNEKLWKICGWHEAAFCLSQETHKIPFVNLKWTRQALCLKAFLQNRDISSLASITEGFPTVCSWVTIYTKKNKIVKY